MTETRGRDGGRFRNADNAARLLMPIKAAEIAEEEALRRLGELAAAEGTAIEICIYGGTATNSGKREGS